MKKLLVAIALIILAFGASWAGAQVSERILSLFGDPPPAEAPKTPVP